MKLPRKLKRLSCGNGLCDAPIVWYLSVKRFLIKTDAVKSKFNYCFLMAERWKIRGANFLPCRFFWGETKSFEICVINTLKRSFVTSREELKSLKYVGLNIEQRQGCI